MFPQRGARVLCAENSSAPDVFARREIRYLRGPFRHPQRHHQRRRSKKRSPSSIRPGRRASAANQPDRDTAFDRGVPVLGNSAGQSASPLSESPLVRCRSMAAGSATWTSALMKKQDRVPPRELRLAHLPQRVGFANIGGGCGRPGR